MRDTPPYTDGQKFRPEAIAKGGKSQFPYLIDPNTKVAMYESADICQYLTDTYGDGSGVVPNGITNGYGSTVAMGLALAPRIGKGSKAVAGVRTHMQDDHQNPTPQDLPLTFSQRPTHTHRPRATRRPSRSSSGGTRPAPSAASSRRS